MELVKFFATDLTIDIKSLVPTSRNYKADMGTKPKTRGFGHFQFPF